MRFPHSLPAARLAACLLAATAATAAAATAQTINPANGHAYQFVPGNVSWTDARLAAAASTFQGVTGHLATIQDAAENAFVLSLAPNGGWIGGFQDTTSPGYSEPGGGWSWVTGEPFTYTNWGPGEPNNTPVGEDVMELWSSGQWNDATDQVSSFLVGYVVEYDLGGCPVEDAFAPNHTCNTAHVFSGSSSSHFVLDQQLVVSNGAPDFFVINDDPGSNVYVRVEFEHAEGDIDLFLYPAWACGGTPSASSAGTGDSESISRSASDPSILEVRRSGGPGSCSAYTLTVLMYRVNGGLGGTLCENGTNSLGLQATLSVQGSTNVTDNDLTLSANTLPANSFGFFLASRGAGFFSPPASQGFVCINSGGIGRFNRPGEILSSGSSPFGSVQLPVDVNNVPLPFGSTSIQPGDRWAFQYWYRDVTSGGAPTSNFSSAQMVWFD